MHLFETDREWTGGTEKMDPTERKITKIAREAGKFTVQAMKEEGIGTAEFDFIHPETESVGRQKSASVCYGKSRNFEKFQSRN